MKKTNKKFLAVTTALASILSAKTSARMNPALKTGLIIGGSALAGVGLINEGLGIFGPCTKWYDGGGSLYYNFFGKKQKKPDEQEPGKKNKKPNSQEENESESTEEQKANLKGFLSKFDGVAQWGHDGKKSGLVNLGSDSQEVSKLKKALETIFFMVVKGRYKVCGNLSENKQEISSMILEWIKGERNLDIEKICVEDVGNGLAIDIFFKPVSKRVRVEVWVGYSEGCIDHITFSCGSDLIEIFPNNAKS